ncbi:MAG TPA: hypothetical protein VJN18_14215 [Polyangiaceae bacterium]|nr:hypothetical protein [Polyangiaceae bacterium]
MKARVLRGARARTLAVLLSSALGGVLGWQRLAQLGGTVQEQARRGSLGAAPALSAAASRSAPGPDPEQGAAEQKCLAAREGLHDLVSLPRVNEPALRAHLLGRAKAAPVMFLSRPEADQAHPAAAPLRQELEVSPGHFNFDRVVGKMRSDPALARAVFLREGYLYTESPELAMLYGSLTLSLLFRDQELHIMRGSEELSARRVKDGAYEYTSGPERGRRAKLLLFDRVAAAGAAWGEPRHVDLEPLAAALGFDELAVSRATVDRLAVELVYGALRVPALLRVEQGKLALQCEAPGVVRDQLHAARAGARRALGLQARLLQVMKEQVDEGLPFDEPKTEDGQQDGKLRPEWRSAYLRGSTSFEFNGDRYSVFDASGRPRPPQVCIDFVLDTFERASGTWWQSAQKRRERVLGRLRFDDSPIENRRSVEQFIEFTRAHPAEFEVYDVPLEERVALRNRPQFFSQLYRARTHYRRGDIVAILGPREDERLHYHSFFVVDSDPLTGMPTELAANAGRPRLRSWEGEMSNAPRRSIVARIRPRLVWLESFLAPENAVSVDVPAGPGPRDASDRDTGATRKPSTG